MLHLTLEEKKDGIRQQRRAQCFTVINRGKLWYDTLTDEQYNILQKWYKDWLDAPETLVIPIPPSFINKKINFEEEVL